jgi:hypothetical protein
MTIIIGSGRISGDLVGDLARIESLTVDLERLGCGILPTPEQLAAAPLLDNYLFGKMSVTCLVGENHGHPALKGRFIKTSELWVVAQEHAWVRTFSRFYRLGTPALPENTP